MKKALSILIGTLLIALMASTGYPVEKKLNFNPKDPKMRDIKTVNDLLDAYIINKDNENVKKSMVYTQERASKYALLILIEFNEDLSMERLEAMRQSSPKRWELFQSYMNKSLAWLSLSRKAENFLGGQLGKTLKRELGEQ